MRDLLAAVRAVAAHEWSDDVEAMDAMLRTARVLDRSTGARRAMVHDLRRRGCTASDVLTWLAHELQRGHGPGWLVQALRADPETVWKAASKGATALVAGHVDQVVAGRALAVVELVAARGVVAAVDDASRRWALVRLEIEASRLVRQLGPRIAASVRRSMVAAPRATAG